MSLALQDWKWEPLIDSDLDKWLLMKDEESEKEIIDPSIKAHDYGASNDVSVNVSGNWINDSSCEYKFFISVKENLEFIIFNHN
ncbi:hypothetical protein Phum_PHUM140080 [Pediculus humanus corporis]|uniref:Uncharacterized protein n=1 Tax=Pediculus humanus subsp. corporis TaxID=121224 RepID=E0VET5_PEDHC|nr:uncharacterized protein Phum_PHUM140080 [Pediculus humanus corporis]EEB11891.1 hypothetical protein Phum_PHUM140080 [Pediculus humanus corporis]